MRRLFLIVLAGFSLMAAGCVQFITPTGPAPLRYRDDIFTAAQTSLTSDVTYGSAMNQQGQMQTLKLDVYKPTTDSVSSRPAIVWIHGGSFVSGNKLSPEIVLEAQNFAGKGYVNFSIDYRLATSGCSAGHVTQACLQGIVDAQFDAEAAVRFVRANAATYGVDPTRIVAAGTSAGAITALNVAYNSEHPGTSGNPGFSSDVRAAVSLSGAKLAGAVAPTDPPSLLFHGTADPLVPYQWAVNTVNQVTAAGVGCYLTTFEGQGHVPILPTDGDGQNFQRVLDQTRNFLYLELDLADVAH